MKETNLNLTTARNGMQMPMDATAASGKFLPKLPCLTLLRGFCLVALLFAMAGCGGAGVDWFPAYHRLPTTPDPFTFSSQVGVATGTKVTSNSITVSGLTGDSSPISISGATGSDYTVNGTAATAAGTVKNGDVVTVSHTSSSALGTSTVSTLSIGNVNGTFTSVTQTVQTLAFLAPVQVGQFLQASASIVSVDGILGTHKISIADSNSSSNAQYELADVNDVPITAFTNSTLTIPVLNGLRIIVRNLPSATSVTTTLTIDGVNFTVDLSHL